MIGGIGTKANASALGLAISNIIIKSFVTKYIIDNMYINVSLQNTLILNILSKSCRQNLNVRQYFTNSNMV